MRYLLLLLAFLFSCSEKEGNLAGGGGVETTNGFQVSGKIVNPGEGAEGTRVYLRTSKYLPSSTSIHLEDTTDESGEFHFTVGYEGQFRLEAVQGEKRMLSESFYLSESSPVFIREPDTLLPSLSWKGELLNPGGSALPVKVNILGLNHEWVIDTTGSFQFDGLPQSPLDFVFSPANTEFEKTIVNWTPADTTMKIEIGANALSVLDNFDDGDLQNSLSLYNPGLWSDSSRNLVSPESLVEGALSFQSVFPGFTDAGLQVRWNQGSIGDSVEAALYLPFGSDQYGKPVAVDLVGNWKFSFYAKGSGTIQFIWMHSDNVNGPNFQIDLSSEWQLVTLDPNQYGNSESLNFVQISGFKIVSKGANGLFDEFSYSGFSLQ